MTKFAFACSTKYQLMNIITFVYYDLERSRKKSDLYIFINDNTRTEFEHIKKKLTEFSIFNRIYFIKDIEYDKSLLKRKINTLYLMLHEKKYIIQNIYPKINENEITKCEILFVPCATFIFEILAQVLRPSEINYIEDGIGSYLGNIEKKTTTKGHRIMNKIFRRNISPHYMYVRNLDFYDGNIAAKRLPNAFDSNLLGIFSDLFETLDKYDYTKYTYIFLEQPLVEISNKLNKEKIVLRGELSHILKNHMVIRTHPRTKKEEVRNQVDIDDTNYFWEYLCLKDIHENHILISISSTAMFSPFLLFQKEPYLIFLFKLISFDEIDKKIYLNSINLLKEKYLHKNKIFIPNTIEELKEILSSLEKLS